MKSILLCLLTFFFQSTLSGQISFSCNTNNTALLNSLIIKEVNKYRKKAKVEPLYHDTALKPAATDHSNYMTEINQITHFQYIKDKKTPKNRVDYYGEQFNLVTENIQQTYLFLKGKHEIKTCEDLAKVLVKNWKNSRPYYENMIRAGFTTTHTSVNIDSKGKIYACQLFGSDAYKNSYRDSLLTYIYKTENNRKCENCENKLLVGDLQVDCKGVISYTGKAPLFKTKFILPRFRINRLHYGLAADIVLKEQYDCDTNIVFNGKRGVRGIPLEPVFKKNFRKGNNVFFWKFIDIKLGVVPEWIDQDYEVNLTVINNKRTCLSIAEHAILSEFHVDIKTELYLDSLGKYYQIPIIDSSTYILKFGKAVVKINDLVLLPVNKFLNQNSNIVKHIKIQGFSSVEGTTENNIKIYKARVHTITEKLKEFGIDSSLMTLSSTENFRDFRNDIIGTQYEYLSKKSDSYIKLKVNDGLSKELEPILVNHRFAEVTIYTEHFEKRAFDKDTVYYLYKKYLKAGDTRNCQRIQAIEYNLALDNKVSINDIKTFIIPNERQYIDLLCDRYLMIYRLDSSNLDPLNEFKDSLVSLKKLNDKNIKVATNLALLKYTNWDSMSYKKSKKYYGELISENNIEPVIKARLALNYATYLDWRLYSKVFSRKRYRYNSIKGYVKQAKLSVSETMDLASYYAFFKDYRFAYALSKKVIYKSKDPDEAVFFLKLIYYLHRPLSEKTILKYFKRLAQLKGKEFCAYFNSPNLNFQILDDPEIRSIYCENCSN